MTCGLHDPYVPQPGCIHNREIPLCLNSAVTFCGPNHVYCYRKSLDSRKGSAHLHADASVMQPCRKRRTEFHLGSGSDHEHIGLPDVGQVAKLPICPSLREFSRANGSTTIYRGSGDKSAPRHALSRTTPTVGRQDGSPSEAPYYLHRHTRSTPFNGQPID